MIDGLAGLAGLQESDAQVALLHRVGVVPIGQSAVVVVVSSPHRPEAFEAARFCIDALKATVPIWKRESWAGGAEWSAEAHDVVEAGEVEVAS